MKIQCEEEKNPSNESTEKAGEAPDSVSGLCPDCNGLGSYEKQVSGGHSVWRRCLTCKGKGATAVAAERAAARLRKGMSHADYKRIISEEFGA